MEECPAQLGRTVRQNGKEGQEQGRTVIEKRNVVTRESSALDVDFKVSHGFEV